MRSILVLVDHNHLIYDNDMHSLMRTLVYLHLLEVPCVFVIVYVTRVFVTWPPPLVAVFYVCIDFENFEIVCLEKDFPQKSNDIRKLMRICMCFGNSTFSPCTHLCMTQSMYREQRSNEECSTDLRRKWNEGSRRGMENCFCWDWRSGSFCGGWGIKCRTNGDDSFRGEFHDTMKSKKQSGIWFFKNCDCNTE